MAIQRIVQSEGLPSHWRVRRGTYYFRVPLGSESAWDGKKTFLLGKSLPEAYRTWAARMQTEIKVVTVDDLLDRYSQRVVPKKAPTTQEGNAFAVVRLKKTLGTMRIELVVPETIRDYFEGRDRKIAAYREIEVLSHAFTKAVEWGYLPRHPFKGLVSLPPEQPKRRSVADWEVIELLSLEPRRKAGSVQAIQAYIRLMLLTGLRRSDLLRMKISSLGEQGIEIASAKPERRFIYAWTDELRTVIALAKEFRPNQTSPWLFCQADGSGYLNENTGRAYGWDSMWGRFVDRALVETKIVERFTEHDLRAKCASDLSASQQAWALFTLANVRATRNIYRHAQGRVSSLGAS